MNYLIYPYRVTSAGQVQTGSGFVQRWVIELSCGHFTSVTQKSRPDKKRPVECRECKEAGDKE